MCSMCVFCVCVCETAMCCVCVCVLCALCVSVCSVCVSVCSVCVFCVCSVCVCVCVCVRKARRGEYFDHLLQYFVCADIFAMMSKRAGLWGVLMSFV